MTTRPAAPTKGRTVLYTLTAYDAGQIDRDVPQNVEREDGTPRCRRNGVAAGQTFPAQIVATWGGTTCNLVVQLDGDCTWWATSRAEGDGEGNWAWPETGE